MFAREPYSTYGGLDAHIPLLCSCDDCATTFVAFSHEFSVGRRNVGTDYTKIYGYNRVAPGNWLYFKGKMKPGVVKSCFQTGDKEVFQISYDGCAPEQVECPKVMISNESAPEGYRLVPAQTAHVLIGDHVYHTLRDQFGVAVGLVSDAGKDKLAVLLEDGSLLFITVPVSMQNTPNDKLSEIVRTKLLQLFSEDARRITVTVGQGIVYLDGIVRSLVIKRALCACVNGIQRVRGCVDFLRVQMETYISDDRLQETILRLLEQPGIRVFNYTVEVQNSRAHVKCSCAERYYPKDLETRISNISGLQDLSLSVESIPENAIQNAMMCRGVESDFEASSRMAGSVIRVNFYNNKYLVEGRVSNSFQRQWAFFHAVKSLKTASIENRLRIS
ncbi:MAG: BON domain-containing protein [Fibrobacter sp.]|nr:BON domain-containing protein [Fibrobacter sp.]